MCEQVKDRNQEELGQKTTAQDNTPEAEFRKGAVGAYQTIEDTVVGGYRKIEDAVVGGYKRMENGVVEGFTRMTDTFVEKLFAREGETVEEAKKRLNGERRHTGS